MSTGKLSLVKFYAKDGLEIDGLLALSDAGTTIIHVHGKCGNFYQNAFIRHMSEKYPLSGVNFLSFNHRGHDCLAEGYWHGKVGYLGGSVEDFSETVLDIQAAIQFVSSFSDRIILQGHSNGCEKVLYFAVSTNSIYEIVLLSPSDSFEMQSKYIAPEKVEEQVIRLKEHYSLDGWEWLDRREYGIRVKSKEYFIPVTAKSLVNLIEGPGFEILNYNREWSRSPLLTRLFAYIGGEDPYVTLPFEELKRQLSARVEDSEISFFPTGDHWFHGLEEEVLGCIVNWIISKPKNNSKESL